MFKRIPTLCLTLFLLAGCTVSTEAAFLKEVPLNTSTQEISVPGEVITAMFELTNEITPDYFKASKKANQIFSPLSLWYALGVLREGASGASLTELNQMMKLSASFDATTVIPILSKTLNFMEASKIAAQQLKIPHIAIAMGEEGAITRYSRKESSSAITFATISGSSAPGQLSLDELYEKIR